MHFPPHLVHLHFPQWSGSYSTFHVRGYIRLSLPSKLQICFTCDSTLYVLLSEAKCTNTALL